MRVIYRNYRTLVKELKGNPLNTKARNSKKGIKLLNQKGVVDSVKSRRKIQAKKEGDITVVTGKQRIINIFK